MPTVVLSTPSKPSLDFSAQGAPSANVIYVSGPPGPPGPSGAQGPQGPAGTGAGSVGVISINGLTGVLGLAASGANLIFVQSTTGFSIYLSGVANSGDLNSLATNLALTGSSLYSLIGGLSGSSTNTFATQLSLGLVSGNLIQTGAQLETLIAATGSQAWNAANGNGVNLSGNLASSGAALVARDLSISGAIDTRLFATGSGLYAIVSGLTGNLAATGSNLQGQINTLTANLTATGQVIGLASGALDVRISATGQQAWTTADANSRALSGNLTSTGAAIESQISSLSGWTIGASGALQAQIGLSSAGVTSLNGLSGALNVVGTGGLSVSTGIGRVIISGDTSISGALTATGVTLIARDLATSGALDSRLGLTGAALYSDILGLSGLINAASAGVIMLNGLSGVLTVVGTGGLSVSTGAGRVIISGDTSISGALTQTGLAIGAISGAIDSRLTNTGNQLYNIITGMSGQHNATFATITNLGLTGQVLYLDLIGLSGQAAATYATVTNLTQTGVAIEAQIASVSGFTLGASGALQAQIALASAGVSALNGLSGALTIVGTGGLTVSTGAGRILVSGDNSISGALTQTGLAIGAISGAVTALITSTGSQLYGLITALSGQANTNYATAANLQSTGQALYADIVGLSGQGIAAYATILNLTQTGILIEAQLTSLSGFTVAASGALQAQIALASAGVTALNGLSGALSVVGTGGLSVLTGIGRIFVSGDQSISGALTQTGLQIGLVSGALTALVANTGSQAWNAANANGVNLSGNLTTTGTTLIARDLATSGALDSRLANTGVQLYGIIVGLSGQANTNYATVANLALTGSGLYALISGLTGNLALTGSNLQSQINTLTTNLTLTGLNLGLVSGALDTKVAATGSQAWNAAQSNALNLSGALTVTGTQLSAVKVTGSAIINVVNLTGIGGTVILYSGNTVYVSGSSAAGGGVPSVNGITSAVTIAGTGGLTVSTAGSTVLVSGDSSISGALTQSGVQFQTIIANTGSTLYVLMTGLSGQHNTNFATIANLQLTGQQILAAANSIGVALSGALTVSGVTIEAQLASLSGFTTGASGALQAQLSAGNSVVKVSGSANIPTANFTGIGTTVVLYSGGIIFISGASAGAGGNGDGINLSGNLATTGSSLYNVLTGASGWLLQQPQVNLAGGTGLLLNTVYYDNLTGYRAYTISGTPLDSSFVTLYVNVTGALAQLAFPTGVRLGQAGTVTGLYFTSGQNVINFTRSNGQWVINDSSAPASSITQTRNPGAFDDLTSGFAPGSQWINPANSLLYECVNAAQGAAIWTLINNEALISGIAVTGIANLSGVLAAQLTATGQQIGVISGALATQITLTGQTLFNNDVNTSGYANRKAQMCVPLSAATVTWTNQPAVATFFAGDQRAMGYVDLTNYTGVLLTVSKLATAAAQTGVLWMGFLGNFSATATAYLNVANNAQRLQMNVANTVIQSGWTPITPAARSGVYYALLGSGGSAAVSPVFGNVTAYFM